jgi:hypothetical protein
MQLPLQKAASKTFTLARDSISFVASPKKRAEFTLLGFFKFAIHFGEIPDFVRDDGARLERRATAVTQEG